MVVKLKRRGGRVRNGRVPVRENVIFLYFNPLRPNCSNCYTLHYGPNLPFLISDIRALWRSALRKNARMSEIKTVMIGYAFTVLNIRSVTV